MSTYIVLGILLVLAGFAIFRVIKNKKSGGCCSNCDGCAMKSNCDKSLE